MTDTQKLTIEGGQSSTVSGLLIRPRDARIGANGLSVIDGIGRDQVVGRHRSLTADF